MKTPKELFIAGLREGNKYAQTTFPNKEIEERLWNEVLTDHGIVQPTPLADCISDVELKPEIVDFRDYLRRDL